KKVMDDYKPAVTAKSERESKGNEPVDCSDFFKSALKLKAMQDDLLKSRQMLDEERQKNAKLEQKYQNAVRAAGSEKSRVEELERIIDKKPAQKEREFKQKIVDLSEQLELEQQTSARWLAMYQGAVRELRVEEARVQSLESMIEKKPLIRKNSDNSKDLEKIMMGLMKEVEKGKKLYFESKKRIDEVTSKLAKYENKKTRSIDTLTEMTTNNSVTDKTAGIDSSIGQLEQESEQNVVIAGDLGRGKRQKRKNRRYEENEEDEKKEKGEVEKQKKTVYMKRKTEEVSTVPASTLVIPRKRRSGTAPRSDDEMETDSETAADLPSAVSFPLAPSVALSGSGRKGEVPIPRKRSGPTTLREILNSHGLGGDVLDGMERGTSVPGSYSGSIFAASSFVSRKEKEEEEVAWTALSRAYIQTLPKDEGSLAIKKKSFIDYWRTMSRAGKDAFYRKYGVKQITSEKREEDGEGKEESGEETDD
ncbi:hypothetical protein PMAYCL1PPCAC_08402, partial [Pristionchus mayeri]